MASYVGCVRRSGRRTRLGPTLDADGTLHLVDRFRVAGSLVAYQRTDAGLGRSPLWAGRIVVRDLIARGTPRRLTAGAVRGMAYAEQQPGDGVRDLVLDAAGDLAWIIQNPYALLDPPPGNYRDTRSVEVYLARRDGAPVLLDQGAAIVPTSLSRKRCTISWTHGAVRRTARLCP